MSLHTRICDIFGIEYPIILAGMGGASNPELAAAVSNAGGLGVLGAATCHPDQLREWIARTRSLTDRPFGVDTLLPASVRRGAAGDGAKAASGPSPADELPELKKFTAEFMEREGLGAFPFACAHAGWARGSASVTTGAGMASSRAQNDGLSS